MEFNPGIKNWFNTKKKNYQCNQSQYKNHIIISTDAEKSIREIQHLFIVYTLRKSGI